MTVGSQSCEIERARVDFLMGFEIFTCGHSYTALIDASKTNPFIRILAAVLATDQLCLYGHADNGPLQYKLG